MAAEEYSWRKTKCYFAGALLVNLEDIEYKRSQDVEVFHGTDGEPSGWGSGEVTGDGKLTVSGQEYQKIMDFAVAQGYDMLKMPPIPIIIVIESSVDGKQNSPPDGK